MVTVVLVTGVSRGIGSAIVDLIFKYEADAVVLGVARSESALQDLKTRFGKKFEYLAADVTDSQRTKRFVEEMVAKHGSLDGIIANAGVLDPVQDVNGLNSEDWKRLFDVNFFSVVSLVSTTIPFLKKSHLGNIVFVSSGASVKPYYAWGAYGSSKAALNHFAQTINAEEPAVNVISVAPGVVDTSMQDDIRNTFGPRSMTPEALKRFADLKAHGQLLKPQVPAAVYALLVLKGIPHQLKGKYVRYNDDALKDYQISP
ncbi:LAMI_0F03290g1_1 [Lachancea mirantina]|uniref:LAMI_0F03290g1_1 n=1 Tax=Lachancea mirantina TaxID=1230905 RepID=A0A1G4JX81_9SACH|nr:LAMI_0F03290g1_1 [Lachancea mirantina]